MNDAPEPEAFKNVMRNLRVKDYNGHSEEVIQRLLN